MNRASVHKSEGGKTFYLLLDKRVIGESKQECDAQMYMHWMCKLHFKRVLPITNKKDYDLVEYWDDRAVQVIPDTGERVDGKP